MHGHISRTYTHGDMYIPALLVRATSWQLVKDEREREEANKFRGKYSSYSQ